MEYKTKGIAFKNFRRFQNFPMLELGPITYMVGPNNSGKSTMVKAYLLIIDYLQNQQFETFSFDSQVLEEVNIVTFGRAHYNKAESLNIDFTLSIDELTFKLSITAKENDTKANVLYFEIIDQNEGIKLIVDYASKSIILSKKQNKDFIKEQELKEQRQLLKEDLTSLRKELDTLDKKNLREYLSLSDKLNTVISKLLKVEKSLLLSDIKKDDFDFEVTSPLHLLRKSEIYDTDEDDMTDDEVILSKDTMIQEFISIVRYHAEIQYKKDLEKARTTNDKDFNPESFDLFHYSSNLERWADKVKNKIEQHVFHYIPANPTKQSALFYLRDKNNALAQAIHNYYQLTEGKSVKLEGQRLVKQWLTIFEIGVDFNVKMNAGEAYEFTITEQESDKPISLSDQGMGTLQVMTLILKMVSLILAKPKNKKQITILIEEPELNLHPALQSKLTDFFHEVYIEYGFNFILETHSEYMIRRSQLLALENDYLSSDELNPNPFSVFYFHKEEGPYKMNYKTNGDFDKNFGKGFLDVVDNIALEIFLKNNSDN